MGHNYIGVEHLLLGIIKEGEGTAVRILEGLNCDLQKLRKLVEGSVRPSAAKPGGSSGNIPLVKQAEKILKITYLEAKVFKSAIIGTEHLLLSILKDEDNVATRAFKHSTSITTWQKKNSKTICQKTEEAPLHVLTTLSLTVTLQEILEKTMAAHPVPQAPQHAKEIQNRRRPCLTTLGAT